MGQFWFAIRCWRTYKGSFDEYFPWFKDAPIGKILNIEEPTDGHFYWPGLDIDLSLEIIEHPEKFPLTAR